MICCEVKRFLGFVYKGYCLSSSEYLLIVVVNLKDDISVVVPYYCFYVTFLFFGFLWYSVCLSDSTPCLFGFLSSTARASWKPLGSPLKIVMSGSLAV